MTTPLAQYSAAVLVVTLLTACSANTPGMPSTTGTGPLPVVVTPVPVPLSTRPPANQSRTPTPRTYLIGRRNPQVTQATIRTTVCVPGWTATIRPSATYTNTIKRMQLPPGADLSAYEEDHLIPLSLGGAPRDPRNLWPIAWKRAKLDDVWETRLHKMLCAGNVSLATAQSEISAIKRKP